mmetsp:Transcript_43163/g.111461  ORF Transcript_43163/g.111461 Transcript_43163/m.111461 type:complete len:768 (+) Transcript_43163:489-2792(+)
MRPARTALPGGLHAEDLEDEHPPHFEREVLGLVVQEALELGQDGLRFFVSVDLAHDELEHALLLGAQVLRHLFLHPGPELLLYDVVVVDALPVDVVGKGLGLVRRHLLDQPAHLVVPELDLGDRRVEPCQRLVLARLAVWADVLRLAEERLHARRGRALFTDLLHVHLDRLHQLGRGRLLLLLLFGLPGFSLLGLLRLLLLPHLALGLLLGLPLLVLLAPLLRLGLLLGLAHGFLLHALLGLLLILLFADLLLGLLLLRRTVRDVLLGLARPLLGAVLAVPLPVALVAVVLAEIEVTVLELALLAVGGRLRDLQVAEVILKAPDSLVLIALELADTVLVLLVDVAVAILDARFAVPLAPALPVVPRQGRRLLLLALPFPLLRARELLLRRPLVLAIVLLVFLLLLVLLFVLLVIGRILSRSVLGFGLLLLVLLRAHTAALSDLGERLVLLLQELGQIILHSLALHLQLLIQLRVGERLRLGILLLLAILLLALLFLAVLLLALLLLGVLGGNLRLLLRELLPPAALPGIDGLLGLLLALHEELLVAKLPLVQELQGTIDALRLREVAESEGRELGRVGIRSPVPLGHLAALLQQLLDEVVRHLRGDAPHVDGARRSGHGGHRRRDGQQQWYADEPRRLRQRRRQGSGHGQGLRRRHRGLRRGQGQPWRHAQRRPDQPTDRRTQQAPPREARHAAAHARHAQGARLHAPEATQPGHRAHATHAWPDPGHASARHAGQALVQPGHHAGEGLHLPSSRARVPEPLPFPKA